jgi:hypothetical protein
MNNQEAFDVNVAILVKLFTRAVVGTAVSMTEILYSIGHLLLFFFLLQPYVTCANLSLR